MKYLLDTHYVLWTLFEPTRIDIEIKKIFKNNNVTKYVSGITLWEISLKYSIGKLELEGNQSAKSYGFCSNWWSRRGSNPRPPRCERGALPAELLPHIPLLYRACRTVKPN